MSLYQQFQQQAAKTMPRQAITSTSDAKLNPRQKPESSREQTQCNLHLALPILLFSNPPASYHAN